VPIYRESAGVKILVLGCGPSGVVTALGLRALGYDVSVIGEVRPYPVTEGISARVYKALADSKLIHALVQGIGRQ
jgi:2-polyprenyl-6-methoxyphenol hydroxylase-like FAD-dependent oxidoreductase